MSTNKTHASINDMHTNTNSSQTDTNQEPSTQTKQEYDMLNAPVFPLFMRMAIPIIIGLLINGLYSFVDAIFISRAVGTDAIGGVSAAFPVHMILISISAMIASGMASLLSRQLGAGKKQQANAIFSQSMCLTLSIGIFCSAFIILFRQDIFSLMKLPIELHHYAIEYITPIALFAGISFCSSIMSDAFRAEGKTIEMMKLLMLSSILNIILDGLFLFVFEWGVAGAAWATVTAISISFIYAIRILYIGDHLIRFEWILFRFNLKTHLETIALGIPVFLSYTGYAVMLSAVNYAIVNVAPSQADVLISGHGVFNRTFMLIFLPVLGMMIAFQTFAGFNYGAKQNHRVIQVLKVAILTSGSYALLWSALMLFKSQWLFQLFTDDQALIAAATSISSVVFIGFFTVGIGMMCPALFQALGFAKPAALLNAFHTYVLLLPVLWIFSNQFGVSGIWWTFPTIDFIAAIVVGTYTYRFVQNKLKAGVAHPPITA
jgi:putative MATE family efflux protein